jgi:flagellar secretion chaperone FliS
MSNRSPNNPRLAYRQAAVETATPLGLVVILYDLALEDFGKASAAIEVGDVEARTAAVHHGLSVLEQLQGRLDFDKGGDVARHLDRFYSMIRGKMLEAQMKCSRDIFQELTTLMMDMRRAWKQVEEQAAPQAPAERTASAQAIVPIVGIEEMAKSTWSA